MTSRYSSTLWAVSRKKQQATASNDSAAEEGTQGGREGGRDGGVRGVAHAVRPGQILASGQIARRARGLAQREQGRVDAVAPMQGMQAALPGTRLSPSLPGAGLTSILWPRTHQHTLASDTPRQSPPPTCSAGRALQGRAGRGGGVTAGLLGSAQHGSTMTSAAPVLRPPSTLLEDSGHHTRCECDTQRGLRGWHASRLPCPARADRPLLPGRTWHQRRWVHIRHLQPPQLVLAAQLVAAVVHPRVDGPLRGRQAGRGGGARRAV